MYNGVGPAHQRLWTTSAPPVYAPTLAEIKQHDLSLSKNAETSGYRLGRNLSSDFLLNLSRLSQLHIIISISIFSSITITLIIF